MGEIILTTPRTSNNYLGRLTEPHTFIKSKSAAAAKGGKLRRSVNFNTDFMDEGNDSDGELGNFLMLFLKICSRSNTRSMRLTYEFYFRNEPALNKYTDQGVF